MIWGKKMTVQEMTELRHKIVTKMTGALARSNMKKFHELNEKYQKLSDRIKKEKK